MKKVNVNKSASKLSPQMKYLVDAKCKHFVKDVVFIFERTLSAYFKRLESKEGKSGKWADLLNKVTEQTQGGTEGLEAVGTTSPTIVAINFLNEAANSIGIWHNRKELKKLIHLLYTFVKDPVRVRADLVRSGTEIFEKFERQFVQVEADKSWERAMTKLAEDAVGRCIDYHKNSIEEFSAVSITKGAIFGKSKKYKNTSTGLSKFKAGHTLDVINTETKWNTANLFDTTATYKKDGNKVKSEYGCRLPFVWEKENNTNDQEIHQEEYSYILNSTEKEKLVSIIIEEIKGQDPNLMEERLSNEIEEIKQKAEEFFKEFTTFIGENYEKLEFYLQDIKNELIEAKQQRLQMTNESNSNHKKTQNDIKALRDEIKTEFFVEKDQVKAVWFNVKEAVELYTGREDELNTIASHIIKETVIISGLGGMGKSELARKYAHSHYTLEDTVLWINSETRATAIDSFRELMKENGRKTTDKDHDDMTLKCLAKESYKWFAGKESLVILDNAMSYALIKEFLPQKSSKFRVLITTHDAQILDKEDGNVKLVNVEKLSEEKALQFVKAKLKINHTTQHDEEVKRLATLLGCLPLALEHAVRYFKKSWNAEAIGKYVELLEKSSDEREKILNRDGLSGHDKSIYLSFKIAIDAVKKEEDGTFIEEILNCIAYLASENIPEEALSKLANDKTDEVTSKDFVAAGMLNRAIDELNGKSMISLDDKKERRLNIHRLLQEVIRFELRKKGCEEEFLEKVLNLLKACKNTATCIPHIISIWNYAYKYQNLINRYIVDSNTNKATTLTTYFHLIVEGSNLGVIRTIMEKITPDERKNVINATGKYHETSLHKAVFRDDYDIILLLINAGGDVNAKKTNGWSPLHVAAKNGNLEIVKVLLEKSANIDEVTKFKFTPLHLAARQDFEEIVKTLLEKGANVNAQTGFGFTPLHQASENGNYNVVNVLINQADIMVNAETNDKFTPLHCAVKKDHLQVVEALLDKNADVNMQNKDGFSALHYAALNGNADIVDTLLRRSEIVINAITTKGNTPLHLAAEKGNLNTVEVLIKKNADIEIRNEDDKTASDIALDQNIADYFLSTYKRKAAGGLQD